MSDKGSFLKDIRSKICSSIDLKEEGLDRYLVRTPFHFNDGDSLKILLKKTDGHWLLTDEAHTLMHLSYQDLDLEKGTRNKILNDILSIHSLENDEGEFKLSIKDVDDIGNALYTYIQSLIKITDLSYLKRERARSTFLEDFRSMMIESTPELNVEFDYTIPNHELYPVDCLVKAKDRDFFVYSILNDDKCRDTTIEILHFEKIGIRFSAIGVFENQENINRKVLARFSNVCDKQFSSLSSARERISRYLLSENMK